MNETLIITYYNLKNFVIGILPILLTAITILYVVWGIRTHLVLLRSGKSKGRRAVFSGIAFFIVRLGLIVVLLFLLLPALPHPHDPPRRLFCARNLKNIWRAMEAYASDHNGLLPPIDNMKNNFIMSGDSLFPEYMADPEVFACPSDAEYWPGKNFVLTSLSSHPGSSIGDAHPDCITDMSYCYFGWIITNQTEAETFFEAYERMSPDDCDKDIMVPDGRGNGGGSVIYRLRTDMSKLPQELRKDASHVPVLWDKPSIDIANFNHVPAGCNVLYLDGHVDFIRVEAPWGEGEDRKITPFPVSHGLAKLLDERSHGSIPDCFGFDLEYEKVYGRGGQ